MAGSLRDRAGICRDRCASYFAVREADRRSHAKTRRTRRAGRETGKLRGFAATREATRGAWNYELPRNSRISPSSLKRQRSIVVEVTDPGGRPAADADDAEIPLHQPLPVVRPHLDDHAHQLLHRGHGLLIERLTVENIDTEPLQF